jgi:hypothetical protein
MVGGPEPSPPTPYAAWKVPAVSGNNFFNLNWVEFGGRGSRAPRRQGRLWERREGRSQ